MSPTFYGAQFSEGASPGEHLKFELVPIFKMGVRGILKICFRAPSEMGTVWGILGSLE